MTYARFSRRSGPHSKPHKNGDAICDDHLLPHIQRRWATQPTRPTSWPDTKGASAINTGRSRGGDNQAPPQRSSPFVQSKGLGVRLSHEPRAESHKSSSILFRPRGLKGFVGKPVFFANYFRRAGRPAWRSSATLSCPADADRPTSGRASPQQVPARLHDAAVCHLRFCGKVTYAAGGLTVAARTASAGSRAVIEGSP